MYACWQSQKLACVGIGRGSLQQKDCQCLIAVKSAVMRSDHLNYVQATRLEDYDYYVQTFGLSVILSFLAGCVSEDIQDRPVQRL